jgi:hypothetical protein
VAAEARTELAPPRGQAFTSLRAFLRVTPAQAVALVVAASVIGRTFAGWLRATPMYFPDEYIYSEVGRSIADHGRPLVRGASAHFPALLQPLLTAPAWLTDDVMTSFRAIQLINAVAMSLGAVVVYRLARRLDVNPWLGVGLAAFAVAIPDLLYAGWILADPLAYPLVLASVAAATATLDRPTRRSQVAFVAFAGLATIARIQFVVLPVCFVATLILLSFRERRLKQGLREQKFALGLLAAGLVLVLVAGPKSVLGYYDSVTGLHLSPLPILRWMGSDGMLLLYSSGWVLVPGALIGLALALWKPRSRAEFGFAAFSSLLALAVVFEAALYAANGADRIQERYFFALLPLVAILFVLYASRGFPHRVAHALGAGAAIAISARLPLSGFAAADGKSNSPLLFAVGYLEQTVGDVGLASLLIAGIVAVLSIGAALLVYFRPRVAAPILVGVAVAAGTVASFGAATYGNRVAGSVYDNVLWPDPSYVDHANLGSVALVETPWNDRGLATEQLFWNRSLDRLLLLPDATPPDAFGAEQQATLGADGSILVAGQPFNGPMLVDAYSATTEFRGATQVARTRIYRLLQPTTTPRLSLYVTSRFYDGWLGPTGKIQLWPEQGEKLAGHLRVAFSLPAGLSATTMELTSPGGSRKVDVVPGKSVTVTMPVCSSGSWAATFDGPVSTNFGDRLVTVRSTKPAYTPDPSAC